MWESTVDGRVLHFHLAGINNQNFIMRDEETGSWWQQVTGECVLGPLKGRRLKPSDFDELTFAEWKRESPVGRVLRPDPKSEAAGDYETADWEQRMERVPVATTLADPNAVLPARTLVVGVQIGGASEAYPLEALRKQNPIIDTIGTTPVLVLLAEDGKSVRVFNRSLDGRALEFFKGQGASDLFDSETGSRWDFGGAATSGALAGRRLEKITSLKDYWFNWKTYHPNTGVYLH